MSCHTVIKCDELVSELNFFTKLCLHDPKLYFNHHYIQTLIILILSTVICVAQFVQILLYKITQTTIP